MCGCAKIHKLASLFLSFYGMCLILMYFFLQTPFLPRVLCVCVCVCVCARFLSHLFNCSHIQRRQRVMSLSLSLSLSFPPSFALNACPGNYTAFLSFFFGFVSIWLQVTHLLLSLCHHFYVNHPRMIIQST